jgi:hypothetical protein
MRAATVYRSLNLWPILGVVAALTLAGDAVHLSTAANGQTVAATVFVRQAGRVLNPVAKSPRYLVWESGPLSARGVPTLLRQRDLGTGSIRTLAQNADRNAGVAVTRRWVAYVAATPSPTLFIVRHDGSQRHAIGHNVSTPIASRGVRLAWADQTNKRQRIYVANLASGHRWLAAAFRRCVQRRCYRIDYVTLGQGGVVFTRGAVGPQPSFVLRRRFRMKAVEAVRLPGDPQPDLARSSAGALYYYFGHGWYRWDFGHPHPTLTRFKGSSQVDIVGFEQGTWYLIGGNRCHPSLRIVRPSGRATTLMSARRAARRAAVPLSDCVLLTSTLISAAGVGVVTAWAFEPNYSINAHVDFGLVGAIESIRLIR